MNLKQFKEKTVGTVVQLLPKPTFKEQPIRSEHNAWLVVEEIREGVFLLQNRTTRHEIQLGSDNIQEFRTPNLLILRGQVILKEEGKIEFEPSAPGLVGEKGLAELTDGTHWSQAKSVYEALKPHEGQLVTLRFPDKGDWQYGSREVFIDKCTPQFVTLRSPKIEIKLPYLPKDSEPLPPIPEKIVSIPLQQLTIAEDVLHDKPLLFLDYSFWEKGSPP